MENIGFIIIKLSLICCFLIRNTRDYMGLNLKMQNNHKPSFYYKAQLALLKSQTLLLDKKNKK